MAEGNKSWTPNWGRWKSRLKWLAAVAVMIAIAAAAWWWFPFSFSNERAVYDVYVATNGPGEDRDQTASDIQAYLSENFPPDQYEYCGIIAQRLPTSQSPTTTTYVLFKRK